MFPSVLPNLCFDELILLRSSVQLPMSFSEKFLNQPELKIFPEELLSDLSDCLVKFSTAPMTLSSSTTHATRSGTLSPNYLSIPGIICWNPIEEMRLIMSKSLLFSGPVGNCDHESVLKRVINLIRWALSLSLTRSKIVSEWVLVQLFCPQKWAKLSARQEKRVMPEIEMCFCWRSSGTQKKSFSRLHSPMYSDWIK